MNENEIKRAFDEIEPESGAQERMYANILKKAAAQSGEKAVKNEPTPAKVMQMPARRPTPLWKRYGALAACLVLVVGVTLGYLYPHFIGGDSPNDPNVMVGSPFEDVQGAADFEKLGFSIDAPEGAEDVTYCIMDGEIAQVDFTLDGRSYLYRAAKLDGDFSGANGEVVGSASLNAEYDAVLDRLSPEMWRAHWSKDGISYYLSNFDGASEEMITAAAELLMGQN